ncbi:MAG TPA: endonuclease/exonuclease/phosphatase family protein [Clostridia bacterium]|nr:endonuclease/exonuclease/phosphatase family protein [Clostridia bacterium]
MNKLVKGLLTVIVGLFLFLGFFTLVEYRPKDIEEIQITSPKALDKKEVTILSYNIGYAGLGKNEDFFMDGGEKVRPQSKDVVEDYLRGLAEEIKAHPADFYLIQEVDLDSKRSYGINQKDFFEKQLGLEGNFAYNYKALYVPYPFPTIGRVNSGLVSLSSYKPQLAYRKSLPVPFSWPVRTVNLKRCLLVEEYEIEGSDKNFILINLHLEAFDDGEGKILQSRELLRLAQEYYEQGHYVLVGGDWNQTFPGGEIYPLLSEEMWVPGTLIAEDLPPGWRYASDPTSPSCRSGDKPYDQGQEHQVYLIDGYLLSPNLEELSIKTLDYGFSSSDHHPVELRVKLKE